MNIELQGLENKVENQGKNPQGRISAAEWNILLAAVKVLDRVGISEDSLEEYLEQYQYITQPILDDILANLPGGGGGGLDEETLLQYLTQNEYAQKSDIPKVYEWAQATTKPPYDYNEIKNTPTIPTVPDELPNPKALKWAAGNFGNSSSSPYYGSTTKTIYIPTSVSHLTGGTLDGDLAVSGHIASLSTSDERLKKNIREFSATDILASLGGVWQYEYTPEEVEKNPRNAGTHIGFIYQNVAKSQMADMTIEREDGYGALNYLHPDYLALLAAANLELMKRVEVLEKKLNEKNS